MACLMNSGSSNGSIRDRRTPAFPAGFKKQDVAAACSLCERQIARAGAVGIQRRGNLLRGDRLFIGRKARRGTIGCIDPVAAEKKNLARLERRNDPGGLAVNNSRCNCGLGESVPINAVEIDGLAVMHHTKL